MAGTFKRKHFKAAVNLDEHQFIPIVSPIGLPTVSKSFVEKFVVKPKQHQRKGFSDLILDKDLRPLRFDLTNVAHNVLEMVRWAPCDE